MRRLPLLLVALALCAYGAFVVDAGSLRSSGAPQEPGASSSHATDDRPAVEPGVVGHLESQQASSLWLAKDDDAYRAYTRAALPRDEIDFGNLLGPGRLFEIEEDTLVRVVEVRDSRTLVRVQSGVFDGVVGWVATEWIVPSPRSEQPVPRAVSEESSSGQTRGDAQQKPFINIGTVGRLHASGEGSLWVATDADAFEGYIDAAIAKDDFAFNALVRSGRLLRVEEGVDVKVIDRALLRTRVRLEGSVHRGRAVWVPTEWVQPD